MDHQREGAPRARLLVIDEELRRLTNETTSHVGCDFVHCALRLFGTVREISGGPCADVGDLWFAIWNPEPQEWEVSASIPVYCDRRPPGYSCLHDLYDEHRHAQSPEEAVESLAELLAEVREQLPKVPAVRFHKFPHSELADC